MFQWSRGPTAWLYVTSPSEWFVIPSVAVRIRTGMVLRATGSAEPLMKYSLSHTNNLNFEDLKRCCEFLELDIANKSTVRELLAALAQHFSPDNEVFKQVVLRSYGLHGRGNQVSPMTEAVLENMDPDDRAQYKDLDKTLKEQRQKQRRVEHALKRKRARCAQVRPKKKSRAAPDVAAPIVVAPVDVAAPIDAAPADVVAQIDVAPVDAVAPIDVAPEPSEQPRRPMSTCDS